MTRGRAILVWCLLGVAIAVPISAAAFSPLLSWRDPIYIAAGFAGIFAMSLLLMQPLLIGNYMPGLSLPHSRRLHKWIGVLLVILILLHVGGLWITSPPDVLDALLFRSPTPFSLWGMLAMLSVFAAALLAALRHRLPLAIKTWRKAHTSFVAFTVIGSVVHALLIEGTMETVSKAVLCFLAVSATFTAIVRLKIWRKGPAGN